MTLQSKEIEGAPGRLIAQLVDLILTDNGTDPARWFNWSFYICYWIGATDRIEWRPPQKVQRTAVRDVLEDRLLELIRQGVEEEFLVRAVLDGLDRYLHEYADVGETDRKRALTRESLLNTIEDPLQRQQFRERLAEQDPSLGSISEAELIEKLRHMKDDSIASPVTPEEATRAWAVLEEFRQLREELLPDELIKHWRSKNMLWHLR